MRSGIKVPFPDSGKYKYYIVYFLRYYVCIWGFFEKCLPFALDCSL